MFVVVNIAQSKHRNGRLGLPVCLKMSPAASDHFWPCPNSCPQGKKHDVYTGRRPLLVAGAQRATGETRLKAPDNLVTTNIVYQRIYKSEAEQPPPSVAPIKQNYPILSSVHAPKSKQEICCHPVHILLTWNSQFPFSDCGYDILKRRDIIGILKIQSTE